MSLAIEQKQKNDKRTKQSAYRAKHSTAIAYRTCKSRITLFILYIYYMIRKKSPYRAFVCLLYKGKRVFIITKF